MKAESVGGNGEITNYKSQITNRKMRGRERDGGRMEWWKNGIREGRLGEQGRREDAKRFEEWANLGVGAVDLGTLVRCSAVALWLCCSAVLTSGKDR
jgi:hypothetical protein